MNKEDNPLISKAYLFSYQTWCKEPYKYILSYGYDEQNARENILKNMKITYKSGVPFKPKDFILNTIL